MKERFKEIQDLEKRYFKLADKMMFIGSHHPDYDIDEFFEKLKVSYEEAIEEYLEEGLMIDGNISLSEELAEQFKALLLDNSFSFNEKCLALNLPWLGIKEDDSKRILKTIWEMWGTTFEPFPPDVKL